MIYSPQLKTSILETKPSASPILKTKQITIISFKTLEHHSYSTKTYLQPVKINRNHVETHLINTIRFNKNWEKVRMGSSKNA